LMDRATPEQLAALAAKFNEAPTDARTLGGLGVFFQVWTQLDPKAALIGAFQLNDITFRKLAAVTVVNSASPSAAPELLTYIIQYPAKDLVEECKNRFLSPLIDSWSTLDPEAASKFMDELGDTKNDLNSRARSSIAENWGSLDPDAALEWIEKQKDKDFVDRDSLYDKVINGWCLKDMGAASAYVAQHLDDPAATRAASTVAEAMFMRDPDNATAWMAQMPQGRPRSNAESTIANLWSQKDPTAASRWMATLPTDDQTEIVGTIVTNWASDNWPETSRWIETLSGDVRDRALSSAMDRNNSTNSDSLTLALSIRDDEFRHDRIESVIQSWSYRDPEAAEAWVKNSPLSPEERQHLLSVIEENRRPAEEQVTE